MTLLLISETAIVEQIFSLICGKMNIDLEVSNSVNVNENYDFIIIDQKFIDDKFNIIKQYSKKLGAISSEDLPFDKSRDFIIPRPFLPTKLKEILEEQIKYIKEDEEEEKFRARKVDEYEDDDTISVPVNEYIETLADNIYEDIEDESDESIINPAALKDGGVLDMKELSKINDILKEEESPNNSSLDENDWQDISSIIDNALDEVRHYEVDLEEDSSKVYTVVLNNYNITELKPLLTKLNQNLIDKLSNGEVIDLKLMLKGKNKNNE